MSVNASKHDNLLYLIYRHLKDNGFQSAASELQKHAPTQRKPKVSASILEVYSYWLDKHGKEAELTVSPKKRQSDAHSSSGSSESDGKKRTPSKSIATQPKPCQNQAEISETEDDLLSQSPQAEVFTPEASLTPPGRAVPASKAKTGIASSETASDSEQDSTEAAASTPTTKSKVTKTTTPSPENSAAVSKESAVTGKKASRVKQKAKLCKVSTTSTPANSVNKARKEKLYPQAKPPKTPNNQPGVQIQTPAEYEKAKKESNTPATRKKAPVKADVIPEAKTRKKKGSSNADQETMVSVSATAMSSAESSATSKGKNKSLSVKRKRSDGSSADASIKVKKAKPQLPAMTQDDDSDSDSSLDVEKWKKLALQLSEADVAKIETFNAVLVEAKPRKPRVRKPRAKIEQNGKTTAKVEPKTLSKASKPQTSRAKRPAPVSLPAAPSIDTTVAEPPSSAPSTPDQTSQKDKMGTKVPSEDITDQISLVLKEKKKKKKSVEKEKDVATSNIQQVDAELKEEDENGKPVKKKKSKKSKLDEGTDRSEHLEDRSEPDLMAESIKIPEDGNMSDQLTEKKERKKKRKDQAIKNVPVDEEPPLTAEMPSCPTKKKKKRKLNPVEVAEYIQETVPVQTPPASPNSIKKKKKKSKSKEP